MPNFEPLIESISRLIGISGEALPKAAEEGAAKVRPMTQSAPGRSVTGMPAEARVPTAPPTVGRTSLDVERWLGDSLTSDPAKQTKVIHDYLRGAAALDEASTTGASHVRDISVPIWQAAQNHLQQTVDSDPEIQDALRKLYVGKQTQPESGVRSTVIKDPNASLGDTPDSNVVPDDTSKFRQTGRTGNPAPETLQTRDAAWKTLSAGIESQNSDTVAQALEQIHALEPAFAKAIGATEGAVTPAWQEGLDYMQALEQKASEMQQSQVPHDEWAPMLEQFRTENGPDLESMPPRVRRTIGRVEAWADAMKPASAGEMAVQAMGVPRALMSSVDLSAPGRQGLLMVTQPEYWKALGPMVEQLKDPVFFEKSQEEIRSRPTFAVMQESGLAITGLEGERLSPREEAFRTNLAEKIPYVGPLVKASERAYSGFLNNLRANMFDTWFQKAKDCGAFKGDSSASDKKLLNDLSEWINTSTGRGGGKFDPGILSTVLFSPRLAISRLQTFNPQYYMKLSPFVRQAALKANLSAAALVVGLTSLAGLGGAKVIWDFRSPDAGKIRIGNTRIDLGGGHMQFLRFLTQVITAQKLNADTGRVTTLGKGQAYNQSRKDLLVDFVMSKEAPVASLITDVLRGHDFGGKPITWWKEVGTRMIPLAVQDAYSVLHDMGPTGVFVLPAAFVGLGVQSYNSAPKVKIPYLGVNGIVPEAQSIAFDKLMVKAESDGLAQAMALPTWGHMSLDTQKRVQSRFIEAERDKARTVWIRANAPNYAKAVREKKLGSGATEFPLTAPPEAQ